MSTNGSTDAPELRPTGSAEPQGSYCAGRFSAKTALVTGGSSGIGYATAHRLLREGAHVIVLSRETERSRRATDDLAQAGAVSLIPLDLHDPTSITAATNTVAERAARVDVLINSAGIVHVDGRQTNPFASAGLSGWDELIQVNLKGCALLVHQLLPLLVSPGASIVNVSSEGAFKARDTRWIYDLTKAGVLSLTRSLAAALAPRGIRVNAVAPGPTVTEMHTSDAPDPEQSRKELLSSPVQSLLGRFGRPAEIAAAIAFLASDDASYITGTTLAVDGGGAGMR